MGYRGSTQWIGLDLLVQPHSEHEENKFALSGGSNLWITSFLLLKEAFAECQLVENSIVGRR